ncbi:MULTISPECIES: D-alanyl-D-alanine carboxypeptidase/D-alanyl-D-alanine endopeptidase [unclassified Modestobacter]|uniref:D-alanyl-D-alanine carboxypeptidase/D-alanyl-D-alanine endopeptidase n=1 Tax=unclassified Modestobacter TaxID=2643866 RepID=UPI0022AB09E7|nr:MULTISPECIES: D-alanyl-D-alanine carboxypeptidase/D-alanyl-D-alanine-endopeptidase [unclassified Modestobacter]MCZ2825352.1 D-alanyl-D-alanine carboxypeptidase/D-alanyl-D-alanine-endopeptidase [Modestobacter sp. VKM Ac-2981]MCZ2853583.1 D-alanyl-D-alanine carboxypeptidase/D-alanyl-D-alanine-endopeptidase [Modestobacter sp. VKM Ac-2982]
MPEGSPEVPPSAADGGAGTTPGPSLPADATPTGPAVAVPGTEHTGPVGESGAEAAEQGHPEVEQAAEPPAPAGTTEESLPEGTGEAAEARRAAAEQAAADLAAVKRWAAERAAAERAAAEEAERAAAAQAELDEADVERARAEQAAADLAAVREWAAQQAAAARAAEDQAAAERATADQAEAARAEAERATVARAEADRVAAEQVEAGRLAAERAAAAEADGQRAAAAAAMAAERAAIEQETAERAATARAAAAERAAAEDAAAERRAAAEGAAAERAAAERAAVERAAVERAAAERADRAQVHAERAAGRRTVPGHAAPAPAAAGATAATPGPRQAGSGAGSSGRRVKLLIAAVLALVLVAAGVVLALDLTGGDPAVAVDAEQVPDAVLPDLTEPGPVLTPLSAEAPVPDPAALTAVLTPLLAAPALGSGLSAQVVDVATGQVLFDQDAADPGTPASTAKLLTALAALTTLDPTDTLTTTVVAGSTPGEVVLVGGGDPTLSTTAPSVDYPGAATVADLAAQVQEALGGQPVTSVVVDNSLFSGPLTAQGWGADDAPSTYAAPVTATAVDGARQVPGRTPRSGSPGTDAGAALAAALGAPEAAVSLGAAPAGARTLGSVESAPVARLVEQALTASDNLLAESLARHVAIARGLPATFQGAGQAIGAALAEAGLDTTGLALSDASGLSRDDRVPARLLVDVVQAAADGSVPDADVLLSGLPVAGYDGTLTDRAVAGQGIPGSVRAKTGTLLGVNDLAGTVQTADGRLLAFAVLADGTTGSLEDTETALDVVAAALAGCGCR